MTPWQSLDAELGTRCGKRLGCPACYIKVSGVIGAFDAQNWDRWFPVQLQQPKGRGIVLKTESPQLHPPDEARRLRGCINDLTRILALCGALDWP